jgi:hypothetical protein
VGAGDSSAFITKLLAASTLHADAAHTLLHPKPASRALLESGSPRKGHKRLVVWVHAHVLTVLSTGHVGVEFASAFQTVPLVAVSAGEVGDCRVELKQEVAVRSGAPRSTISIPLHILIHHEVLTLPLKLRRHEIH